MIKNTKMLSLLEQLSTDKKGEVSAIKRFAVDKL